MNKAVILAAGPGTRLINKLRVKPKGFLEFGGRSLIERSINNLKSVGISEIIIGTGYLSEYYENLVDNKLLFCVKNNFFSDTGSFFTLYNLNNHLNEDFLLLESDILYEKHALTMLMNHLKDDVILASGKTYSGDEVFIEVNKDHYLLNLSKHQDDLSSIYGELVGISRISIDTYQILCEWAKTNMKLAKKIHYEEALAIITNKKYLYVEKIEDLIWTEIDTKEHYKKALNDIYPKLLQKENA